MACGGTHDELCEISEADEIPCAWHQIYLRLQAQDRLDRILKCREPMTWQSTPCRPIVQERQGALLWEAGTKWAVIATAATVRRPAQIASNPAQPQYC